MSFTEPNVGWNAVLAGVPLGIFESRFFSEHEQTFGQPGTGVVGTGPWKLDKFDSTSGAELSANPHYWGGDVPFATVQWHFFSSENSEALAFRTGEIDVAFPASLKSFAATAGTKLVTGTGKAEVSFWMNTAAEPWSDIHVRRAVAYALDRDSLISAAGAYAEPVYTFIPPFMLRQLGSEQEVNEALASVPRYQHDIDKAKEEMARSAYPDGVSVTLAALNEPDIVNVTQAVISQLSAIGIQAEIKVEQPEANNAELTGADRQAIYSQVVPVGAIGIDPGVAFGYALGSANATEGNWNATNWSTPAVDELVARGLRESDPAKRLDIYRELLEEYGEGVPWVPLYSPDDAVALASGLTWPGFDSLSFSYRGPWPLAIKAEN